MITAINGITLRCCFSIIMDTYTKRLRAILSMNMWQVHVYTSTSNWKAKWEGLICYNKIKSSLNVEINLGPSLLLLLLLFMYDASSRAIQLIDYISSGAPCVSSAHYEKRKVGNPNPFQILNEVTSTPAGLPKVRSMHF